MLSRLNHKERRIDFGLIVRFAQKMGYKSASQRFYLNHIQEKSMLHVVRTLTTICLIFLQFISPSWATSDDEGNELTMMTWWVSNSEMRALDVIVNAAQERQIPLNVLSYESHKTVRERLSDLLQVGKKPDLCQWLASEDLQVLARVEDISLDVPEIERRLFPQIRDVVMVDNKLSAVPVVSHTQNAMLVNRKVLASMGLQVPTTWEAFAKVSQNLRNAGKRAVVVSSEPWQLRMLFNDLLLGIGGAEIFRDFYGDFSETGELKRTLVEIFTFLRDIHLEQDASSQDLYWAKAVTRFTQGDSVFFFLGDFAWSEVVANAPGNLSDFHCAISPSREKAIVFGTDIFIVFASDNPQHRKAQMRLASLVLDPVVQRDFVRLKGGMPVIQDASMDNLAPCAKSAMQLWKDPETIVMNTPWADKRVVLSIVENTLAEVWQRDRIEPEQSAELMFNRVKQ